MSRVVAAASLLGRLPAARTGAASPITPLSRYSSRSEASRDSARQFFGRQVYDFINMEPAVTLSLVLFGLGTGVALVWPAWKSSCGDGNSKFDKMW